MRHGPVEMAGGWDDDMIERDEDSADELEHNASELRRLMPY